MDNYLNGTVLTSKSALSDQSIDFFYVPIGVGTKKGGALANLITDKPHGALFIFDPNKNITKQIEIFKDAKSNFNLPPVIDVSMLFSPDLSTEDNTKNIQDFIQLVKGTGKINRDPILRGSLEFFMSNTQLSPDFRIWNVVEQTPSSVIWGTDESFHADPEFIKSEEVTPVHDPVHPVTPYYVRVTNLEGARLFDSPTIQADKSGVVRYRNILRIVAECGTFVLAGYKVNKWVLASDVEPYHLKG